MGWYWKWECTTIVGKHAQDVAFVLHCVVCCAMLCSVYVFSFLSCFPAGWTRTSRIAWHFSKNFFSAFPNFVGIIAWEEKVEVQGGRISLRDVFKYFWFVLFLKEVLKSEDVWRRHVTGSNEEMLCHSFGGLWSVKIRTWGNESIASSASNRAIPWQGLCGSWQLIPSGLWYKEPVKAIKANEVSVLSSWVSLTRTECESWGRRRKRQFLMRGNDLSLAYIWNSPGGI